MSTVRRQKQTTNERQLQQLQRGIKAIAREASKVLRTSSLFDIEGSLISLIAQERSQGGNRLFKQAMAAGRLHTAA